MTVLWKQRLTFGTNSTSLRDSSATALWAVAGDSPEPRPEGTRLPRARLRTCRT